MEELREILGVLRTSDDDELRPRQDLADLDDLIEEVRRAGTPVHLDNRLTVDGDAAPRRCRPRSTGPRSASCRRA